MDASAAFDHVALRVSDRDAMVQDLLDHFDMRVLERTDRFTLVGADAAWGKITLLDAEDSRPPVADRIVSLLLAEQPGAASAPVQLVDGLVVTFAEVGDPVPRHALVGVTLRAADPPIAAAQLELLRGMRVSAMAQEYALVDVGEAGGTGRITLTRERWDAGAAPSMLDHIGIRVEDAARWRDRAELSDIDVVRWVEAPHSRALFVAGPDGLVVEFVEQTRPFVDA